MSDTERKHMPELGTVHRREAEARTLAARAAGGEELGVMLPPGPLRVLLATEPVDFHKDVDGLAAVVHEQLGRDPLKLWRLLSIPSGRQQ